MTTDTTKTSKVIIPATGTQLSAGAFACMPPAFAHGAGTLSPAARGRRSPEVRGLRAQLEAFSAGVARLAGQPDKVLRVRYAVRLLRVAELMLERGAVPGLDDRLAQEVVDGAD